MSNQFDDGFFDFFDRYTVPVAPGGAGGDPARDDFQLGWDGVWGIMGQDFDGDGFNVRQSVTIPGINITGFTDLSVTAALGALDDEPNFNNYENSIFGQADGYDIFATIDAGPRTLLASWRGSDASAPGGSAGNGDLYLDTDGDGVGNFDPATLLTRVLTDYTFAIAGTGNSLTIEIEVESSSSFEMVAFDNVRVNGVPEPSTLALLALGVLPLLRRRS